MNIPLLHRLRDARGAFVPMGALGADPEAVHRDLAELDAFGFRFERHPYLGVAYRGPADRLCPDQIEWALNTRLVGRRIAVWNRVTSTNDLAARAASSRTNDGLVLLAEEQTAGRGRRGRSWCAPPRSSILMSVLLFPSQTLDNPAWLTALGAVAVASVVEEWTGRPAQIKWPNDVRVAGRKIAGVLVERSLGSIIGLGLNVNLTTADFPEELQAHATSIRMLTAERADRSELTRSLIHRIDHFYHWGMTQGAEALEAPWRARFEPIGRLVHLQTRSALLAGRLLDADLIRGLTLAAADGQAGRIPTHEVLELTCDDDAPAGS